MRNRRGAKRNKQSTTSFELELTDEESVALARDELRCAVIALVTTGLQREIDEYTRFARHMLKMARGRMADR